MNQTDDPFVIIENFFKKLYRNFQNRPKTNKKPFLPTIIIISLIAAIFLFKIFFVYVGPDELGIKVKQVGINAGVQKKVYETGLHFLLPTLHTMERLPKNIQFLELTEYEKRYATFRNTKTARAAHIQTSDGFFVDVDVTVIYKISDPYTVLTKLGKAGIYELSILPKIEPALKTTLGKLTTEEFYNSPLRVTKTHEARDILSSEFKESGLEVLHVLVRYFKYSDEIQKNIEEKKLKDQLVFKNQAEAKAAAAGAILKKVIQEGEANIAVLLEEGKAYETKKNAEKELYSRKKHAEADLLVKLAEARKTSLKNNALRLGGSDKLVGIEMAKVLKGLDTIVLSSDGKNAINPLDIGKILNVFEVK
jgi:regulator of protease activity HflC (stomatin/prohibitin superfamily)